MKTMTCKQLGGACDQEFSTETFNEIASMSKKHGMEMFQKGDEAHLKVMKEMQALLQTPDTNPPRAFLWHAIVSGFP